MINRISLLFLLLPIVANACCGCAIVKLTGKVAEESINASFDGASKLRGKAYEVKVLKVEQSINSIRNDSISLLSKTLLLEEEFLRQVDEYNFYIKLQSKNKG